MTLDWYENKFKNLRVDRNSNRYSVGKAPHKPILLLSLIILNETEKIDLSNIKPNIYLRETWSDLWKALEYQKTGPIHLPMYHLKSDGFWDLRMKDDITPHQPKSLNELMEMVESISLKPELIHLIDDEKSRNELINSILNGGYFSDNEIMNLTNKIGLLQTSFEYEEKLSSMIREEFKMDQTSIYEEFKIKRNPAFRRGVLSAYDETCSVCGMKLVTSSGISVIDAAHILPFSRFKNDDIRNGLSLCKMHHWLFDRGLISIDHHYRILVSKTIENESPDNVISCFHKQELVLPEDTIRYPSPIAIEWHREEVFQV